jgi:hypothetical protein
VALSTLSLNSKNRNNSLDSLPDSSSFAMADFVEREAMESEDESGGSGSGSDEEQATGRASVTPSKKKHKAVISSDEEEEDEEDDEEKAREEMKGFIAVSLALFVCNLMWICSTTYNKPTCLVSRTTMTMRTEMEALAAVGAAPVVVLAAVRDFHRTGQPDSNAKKTCRSECSCRTTPVTPVPDGSDELDREAEWIYRQAFVTPKRVQAGRSNSRGLS